MFRGGVLRILFCSLLLQSVGGVYAVSLDDCRLSLSSLASYLNTHISTIIKAHKADIPSREHFELNVTWSVLLASLYCTIRKKCLKSEGGYHIPILMAISAAAAFRIVRMCHRIASREHLPLILPESLKNLKQYEFLHMLSEQQQGPYCGWFSILNAYAIDTMVRNDADLCSATVQRHVAKEWASIQANAEKVLARVESSSFEQGLDEYELSRLAQMYNLDNVHMITLYIDKLTYYSGNLLPQKYRHMCPKTEDNRYVIDFVVLADFLQHSPNPVDHVILIVPGATVLHAVLVSHIKRDGKKPLLVYMDSNNWPFECGCIDYPEPIFAAEFIKRLDGADRADLL